MDHRLRRNGIKRESLTQARQRGPVDTWGSSVEATHLGRALDVGEEALDDYTHRFHSYPARLHPATARRALEGLGLARGARLLDPFCGSGTVLIEGVRAGLVTSGLDASPLAILIARAKTWAGSVKDRRALVERAVAVSEDIVEEGKAARRAGHEPAPPRRVDRKRQDFLAGWFDPHVRRELEALLAAVTGDEILTAVLSSILIKVSRRTADSRSEVEKRAVARGRAARLLADRTVELVTGLEALWRDAPRGTPPPDVRLGDARKLPAEAGSFNAVLTSPPYAGTYDYAEQHALRLTFLGLGVHTGEIGARESFQGDVDAAIAGWEGDLAAVLAEMARVVSGDGPILVVLGDSRASTRAIYADETVRRLAPAAGLELIAGASAGRPPLGRVETHAFARAPKREHIMWLRRRPSDRPRPPRKNPSS